MSLRKIFSTESLKNKIDQLAQLDEFMGWNLGSKQSDSLDFLIRQELKGWAELQRPPQHTRSRLLLKAAQKQQHPVMENSTAQRRLGELRPVSEGKKPEFLASYLALAFQYNHIRLVT